MVTTPPRDPDILITAAEAYPALERLFLGARDDIVAGFRVFDPTTPLQSAEALATGDRWIDLMVDTLNRGVTIDLTLSDFDPVMAHRMHARAWAHVKAWTAANEMTRAGAARLAVRAFAHPSAGGPVPRLGFGVRTRRTLRQVIRGLPTDEASRRRALLTSPGLAGLVKEGSRGLRMRAGALPHLLPITLHHKMAVFDGRATYLGGLDVNARRLDDTAHARPSQDTWHDLQLIVHDPAVARDAAAFLRALPDVVRGKTALPPPDSAFRATLSQARAAPIVALRPRRHVTGLLDAHLDAIAEARDLIYLETQYFRDRRIARALADAGRARRDLHCLLLVPGAPEDVAFGPRAGLDARFGEYLQLRAIRRVRRAFGTRFFVASPAQPRPLGPQDATGKRAQLGGAPIVYVHSKVAIFDDSRAIVSSANLNGRSMSWDAEAGVILGAPEVVATLKARVMGQWFEPGAGPLDPVPATADLFGAWRDRARDNARRAPADRTGFLLPYDLRGAADKAQALPGAPEAMV